MFGIFGKKKFSPDMEEILAILELMVKDSDNSHLVSDIRKEIDKNDFIRESFEWRSADELWNSFLPGLLKMGADTEQVFASRDVNSAKTKLDDLVNHLKKEGEIPYRLTGHPRRYKIFSIKAKNISKLKDLLAKYKGKYDKYFDFDIYNMIKMPDPPKPEKTTVPPLSPDSGLWKSLEAVVKAVSRNEGIDLKKLKEKLSKEQEFDFACSKEQGYWYIMQSILESYWDTIRDCEGAEYIIDRMKDRFERQGIEIDFDDFYVPEEAGMYKALSVIARELKEQGVLVGWMEGPDDIGKPKSEHTIYYDILIVKSNDKQKLEDLFAKCGGVVHFDFNDAKRLANPLKERRPLINWYNMGQKLPPSE